MFDLAPFLPCSALDVLTLLFGLGPSSAGTMVGKDRRSQSLRAVEGMRTGLRAGAWADAIRIIAFEATA